MQVNDTKKNVFSRFASVVLVSSFLALGACAQNSDDMALPDDTTQEQIVPNDESTTAQPEADASANLTATQREGVLSKYNYVDPTRIVPTKALADTLVYFDANKSKFKNQDYVAVINFSSSSKQKRFFIINMKTGSVWAIHVAHGTGSDKNHDGIAEKFSNTSGAHASSLGYYRTAETYYGGKGYSLRLDGLSSTNSRARSRAVVIHAAKYVQDKDVKQGRSWGCPAVSVANNKTVINLLKGGALINAVLTK